MNVSSCSGVSRSTSTRILPPCWNASGGSPCFPSCSCQSFLCQLWLPDSITLPLFLPSSSKARSIGTSVPSPGFGGNRKTGSPLGACSAGGADGGGGGWLTCVIPGRPLSPPEPPVSGTVPFARRFLISARKVGSENSSRIFEPIDVSLLRDDRGMPLQIAV